MKTQQNASVQENEERENGEKGHSWLKIPVEQELYQPPRAGVILLQVLIGIFFFLLVIRFWYLQMHKGEFFARQAIENRMRQEYVLAPRGRILDLHDRILTDNRTTYGLFLIREDCLDLPATLAQISAWSQMPLSRVIERYQQDRIKIKPYEPLLMVPDINFDLVARIEAEIHAWPGLKIVVRTKRSYPERELFSHILGYVAEVNEQEMEKDPQLAMGDLMGKQGLELQMEKRLRGSKGLYEVEVDAHARVMGRRMRDEPKGGHDLKLALDRDLQQACWDALQGEDGCVVVMEPESGKVRALVTSPAYDNNLFAEGISHKDWEELRSNRSFPLQNRAIQSTYPPGSVWKLMMAALILESGVSAKETVFCPGYAKLGKQIFRCWKHSGHGSLNLEQALIHSCDVYFYLMAEKLGIDRIESFAKSCGFGKPTGIDLPHERSGLVPSKKWKQRRFGRSWLRGDTFNVSIGQGSTLVTPVQMANYVCAILNCGKLLEHAPREVMGTLPCRPERSNLLKMPCTERLLWAQPGSSAARMRRWEERPVLPRLSNCVWQPIDASGTRKCKRPCETMPGLLPGAEKTAKPTLSWSWWNMAVADLPLPVLSPRRCMSIFLVLSVGSQHPKSRSQDHGYAPF